jgi:anti-anti-sigma factor
VSEREGRQRKGAVPPTPAGPPGPPGPPEERTESAPLASVSVDQHGDVAVARLAGELDLSNAATIEDQVTRGLGGLTSVAVDLAGLSYLDSAGLALLSRLAARIAGPGGALRLIVPPDAVVRRALWISGLTEAIPVDETLEAALAALR